MTTTASWVGIAALNPAPQPLPMFASAVRAGPVGAKLQNATSVFFELDLRKNHSPVKWFI